MNQITYPHHLLAADLRRLHAAPHTFIVRPAGRRWEKAEIAELIIAESTPPAGLRVGIALDDRLGGAPLHGLGPDWTGCVRIGHGAQRGRALGFARPGSPSDSGWQPVGRLFFSGPMLDALVLAGGGRDAIAEELWRDERERHSRTIGVLGEETYERLTGARFGIVGLGRMGCILARNAVGLGLRRLALVDPDVVEPHNLGEGDFYDTLDLGLAKVHAWENRLAATHPGLEVEAVPLSVTQARSIDALARCDVLFSAPDHPGARLAVGAVAACYSRVLVEVGTMVPRVEEHGMRMGADVRLILPDRCLLCFGSVRAEAQGRELVASPDRESAFMTGRAPWHVERAGSLHSLNQLAAAVAFRMLEDAAAARVTTSTWCQLSYDAAGRLTLDYPEPRPMQRRGLCACSLAGWGDAGLTRYLGILHDRAA